MSAGCLSAIEIDTSNIDDNSQTGGAEKGVETSSSSVEAGDNSTSANTSTATVKNVNTTSTAKQSQVSGGDLQQSVGVKGYALDSRRIEKLLHKYVNEKRVEVGGRQKLTFSQTLRVSARQYSQMMARNTLGLYNGASSVDFSPKAVDPATEKNLEARYERLGAYQCNSVLSGDGFKVPVSGESVDVLTYSEIANKMDGTSQASDEERVAQAIFETISTSGDTRSDMLSQEYRYHGVGVKNVPSSGYIFVTQDYC
ncbi:MAG: CAP domain-containing protein [Halobacteria archaeon]|nr:CAP domain-containing protein [Halobacteria archaeon]